MYIFRREGPNATVFWDVFMWTDDPDYVPTDDDYRNAAVLQQGTASNPSPGPGATDVPRDAALSWKAGAFAGRHDLYLGMDEAAVAQATTADPAGVYQGRLDTNTYSVAPLAFDQTYYWRVDEVNQTPDAGVIKGTVWSFTTEPYAYAIQPVAATASSSQADMGPEKTIDGSGMTGDLHGTEPTTMWLSAGVQPNWIQYEFDQPYVLREMQVWNFNQLIESFLGFGAKQVTIETSIDGATWTPVVDAPEFAQAPAAGDYAANTTVGLGGAEAKYVRLTINTNYSGMAPQVGLAEVRFSYIPVRARAPQPADAATDVPVEASLNWRPGRQAASHTVYLGSDADAVANGTIPAETVTEHQYLPASLDFGTAYYWRVDEVNAVTYPGNVWSFTTQEYAVVDDFEGYTDQPGEEIFSTWIDGFTNGLSNSIVGYFTASGGTFGETAIIHGGKQSMPFEYNNVKTPYFSEAEREFSSVQDWTVHGADTLVVHFRGNPPAFSEVAGTITMSAGGVDIWNTADEFRFAYKPLTGDGTIVVKVESVGNSDPWAKAGVMMRDSLDPGARNALAYVTPDGRVGWQFRQLMGGTSDSTRSEPGEVTLPHWVRLTRSGSTIKAEHSSNGTTWEPMVEVANPTEPTARDISLGSTIYVGLAVTSHNPNATTTAVFSDASTTGGVAGAWQVQAIGVDQPANDAASLYVAVQDSAGKLKVVTHPDPAATTLANWQAWQIPLSEFSAGGVNLARVKKLILGVGDRTNPKADGAGHLFFDDIGVGHPIP
jgi:regulation of enolase protein 1 (concanavalin A-like superfamily)